MRPKTKNTHKFYHAQTTKNTKNKTTKKKKQTTTTNQTSLLLLFYRIRVHYTVLTQHTTPHTTPNQTQPKHMGRNQQDIISLGVIHRTTLVLL